MSLVIDEQPCSYRKVMIDGVAELVHDVGEDDAWRELYRDLARRHVPAEGCRRLRGQHDQRTPRPFPVVLLMMHGSGTWRPPVGEEAGEGIGTAGTIRTRT